MLHDLFQDLLDTLAKKSGVGQEVLGEVLARMSLRAPDETSRREIAAGDPAGRRPVDQREIPQGTVSKAVKALMDEGLVEYGEKFRRSPEGRTVAPIRLGRLYATAGVKVVQVKEEPTYVTTALLGLDSSRVLDIRRGPADSWDQVADLIHQHVASLKSSYDQDRARRGLDPLRLFGVGVEAGAPVYNGEVMPLSHDGTRRPVPLAGKLHRLFESDPRFTWPVPVVVENDVNALAVLAIHQTHYTDPDLVVAGVFDEGVGGGLVMDGRLRRGSYGRAMEIGHLDVVFPPGHDPEQKPAPKTGFEARCGCGQRGHADTVATPQRIAEELNAGPFEQICQIGSASPEFRDAQAVFTRGGATLGRALAHVSNIVNPSRIVMYLPAALADPKPDTAAEAYLAALETETTRAFAASGRPDYLKTEAFPASADEVALLGAKAAAVCVLQSFIEHALRLDGCKPGSRRSTTSGQALPVDQAQTPPAATTAGGLTATYA
jgi:predicted NBD/HSP70 family sugar kinase